MSVIIKEGLELQDRFWRNIPNGYDENNPILIGKSRLRLFNIQDTAPENLKNVLTHNTFQKFKTDNGDGVFDGFQITFKSTTGIFDCISFGDTNIGEMGFFLEVRTQAEQGFDQTVIFPRTKLTNSRDLIIVLGRVFSSNEPLLILQFDGSSSSDEVSISHINIGLGYPLERKNYDGVQPFDLNIKTQRQNTISENGQYLGSFIKRQYKKISIDQNNIEQNFNYSNPFNTTPITQKVELEKFFNYIAQTDQSDQDFVGNTFFYAWNGKDAAYCWPKSNCEVTYKSATIEGALLDWTLEAETK